MIISISGLTCTGTTTIGSRLADILDFEFYSMGQYYKEYRHDLPKMMADFSTVDMKIERYIEDIVNTDKDVVMEGRTVGISVYTDYSILLHAEIETAICRYMSREQLQDMDTVRTEVIKKDSGDIKRLNDRYGMNIFDKNCYNMDIDTTHHSIDDILNIITDNLKDKFPELI